MYGNKTFRRALRFASAFCLLALLGIRAAAGSAGPAVVAKADFRQWPERVGTVPGFDRASRAAILEYSLALQQMGKLSDDDMLSAFKIKSVNRASVDKWLDKERVLSLLNYQRAAKQCGTSDWTCVGEVHSYDELLQKAGKVHGTMPQGYTAWRDNFEGFARAYVGEQLRLAALFPNVTSEIGLFNDSELNGDKLADRQFFLTFDDGPTATGGLTEKTLAMLRKEKLDGVFFVLGTRFQERTDKSSKQAMNALYSGQCVGTHGWEHKSHAKWDLWQESIERTQNLLKTTLAPDMVAPLFRPPYGQRKADSGAFFQSHSSRVALWDIDSQDWNHHVSADDVINRIITLMLIKRHGVLLFHDVHPKAWVAVPVITKTFGNSVNWGDCHRLAATP